MKTEPSLPRMNNPIPYIDIAPDEKFNKKLKISYKNITATEQSLEEGVKDFTVPDFLLQHGYRLVKALNSEQYRLIAIGEKPTTVYLVELLFRTDIVYKATTCTQVKVWRSLEPQYQKSIGNFPQIFFEYLLQKYNIVVSDKEQTGDGKRFWEKRIRFAFSLKYNIYSADGTIAEDWILTKIQDADELFEKWDSYCWGEDIDVHKNRLLVISKQSLTDDDS